MQFTALYEGKFCKNTKSDKWENGAKYKHKVSTKKRMIKYI